MSDIWYAVVGLFDIIRQIGDADAEQILVENVGSTKRGIELMHLTQLLEDMSPGTHKEAILASTQSLLAGSTGAERDYLFGLIGLGIISTPTLKPLPPLTSLQPSVAK